MSEQQPDRPLLRIVKGNPTAEEIAALVAVVAAAASTGDSTGGSTSRRKRRSEWAAPQYRVRGAHRHGGSAWRLSAR